MRRVSFRVPSSELDHVLDGLLPVLPAGVRVTAGQAEAGLAIVAVEPPSEAEVEALAGRPLVGWQEAAVPADAQERRLAAGVRVGRAVVRPPAFPPPPEGALDIVVEPRSALFGSGSHPTTRMCLDLLLGLAPQGGLADLGCGLGTLAIAAAKLGWAPVVAVDRERSAAEAARDNAERNGVALEARVLDLTVEAPPWQPTLVVNAAPEVQVALIERLPPSVRTVIVSSLVSSEEEEILGRWADAGFEERDRREEETWLAVMIVRHGDSGPMLASDREAGAAQAAPARHASAGAGAPDAEPRTRRDAIKTRQELLDPRNPVERAPALGQLATRLPDGGLVISASRTVEVGARAALVHLPGLFRFDLTPQHETLGVDMRALAPVEHAWEADPATYDGFRRQPGEPITIRGRFELPDGPLGVWLQMVMIGDDDQNAAHAVAKAVIRPLASGQG